MEREKVRLIDGALNCKLKAPLDKRFCKTTHTFKEALEIMMEAVKLGTAFWVLLICLIVVCCSLLAFVHQVLPN